MGLFEETDPRFAGIAKKIGLFVIIAVAGILSVAVFIGVQQDMFTHKTKIYFVAESGQGIKEGMAVKLRGFMIGKLKGLSLDDEARVKVELSINSEYMRWIKTDSKARLLKEGLIGEGIIEILPGSPDAAEIPQYGMIAFERAGDLSTMADELKNEVKPMLADVRELIHYAATDPEGGIKATLRNVVRLTEGFLLTKKQLDELIGNVNSGVAKALPKLNAVLDSTDKAVLGLNGVIVRIDNGVAVVMPRLDKSLDKVDKSLDNVRETTEELKKAVKRAAPEVPALLEKGTATAEGAKEVLDSVKKIWPISSNIEPPKEKILDVDSFE
ncbi:MAG: MlaD family protein [Thermodesulfovibrionales bacterium]|nr:MlaD family protein [Thermodesulfovibrionales bacterium]